MLVYTQAHSTPCSGWSYHFRLDLHGDHSYYCVVLYMLPKFNELGIRSFPVQHEELLVRSFDEDESPNQHQFHAECLVSVILEDGRQFSKVVQVGFDESDQT